MMLLQYSYDTSEKNNWATQLTALYLLLGFAGRCAVSHQQPDSASIEVIQSFANGFSRWKNRIWEAVDETNPALEKLSQHFVG